MGLPSINVIGLRCQTCGEHLAGHDYDRVFHCPSCHRAYETGEAGLEEIAFMEVRAKDEGAHAFFLPIWLFEVDVNPVEPGEQQRERGAPFFGKGKVFVSGFRLSHRGYYGDPGISLTRHWYLKVRGGEAEELKLEKALSAVPFGCTVGSSRAMIFTEPVLLSIIDPVVDVTGLSLQITFERKSLLSVSFRRTDNRIGCLDLSDEYPVHAFPDIPRGGTGEK